MAYGLNVVRNPIPIPALKHVNTYILFNDSCAAVVDPGMGEEAARNTLDHAKRLGLEVEVQVVTHFHVDHSTAAGWIEARLAIGERDWKHIVHMVEEWPEPLNEIMRLYASNGMPRDEVEELGRRHPAFSRIGLFEKLVEAHEGDAMPLRDGDTLNLCGISVKVVAVPGHTPGHIALLLPDQRILVGDHVLNDITPNITVLSMSEDPLSSYIESLRRVASLRPLALLPGHRDPVRDPVKRVKELLDHHERRLNEVIEVLRRLGEATAYQVASMMRWDVPYRSWSEFPLSQKYFALGEALAHLIHLERRGVVRVKEVGGVNVFSLKS